MLEHIKILLHKLVFCKKTENEFVSYLKIILGFSPHNIDLYLRAFTHKSFNNSLALENNERLEFLGDRVLDIITAHLLYEKFEHDTEGVLTAYKSKIVSRKNLNAIALTLELQKFMLHNVAHAESNDIMGNTLEALVGAVFLDKGYMQTEQFVKYMLHNTIDIDEILQEETNYKSRFNEYIQKNNSPVEISIANSTTQPHIFECVISIENNKIGFGTGTKKRDAEEEAAKQALEFLSQSTLS